MFMYNVHCTYVCCLFLRFFVQMQQINKFGQILKNTLIFQQVIEDVEVATGEDVVYRCLLILVIVISSQYIRIGPWVVPCCDISELLKDQNVKSQMLNCSGVVILENSDWKVISSICIIYIIAQQHFSTICFVLFWNKIMGKLNSLMIIILYMLMFRIMILMMGSMVVILWHCEGPWEGAARGESLGMSNPLVKG